MSKAAVQDRLNEQEGVPSVFNPPPSRPLQVNTADHRIYSYVVSRPQPRASYLAVDFVLCEKQNLQAGEELFSLYAAISFLNVLSSETKRGAVPSASVTTVDGFSMV